jgi:hypothetical protein
MIDYFSHVAALQVCKSSLKISPPSDMTNPKAVPEALLAADNESGSAILGALFDHLLQYSQNETSVEINILRHAAALFHDGRAILKKFSAVRPSLEAGLTTPAAPGVLAAFNTAVSELPGLVTEIENLQTKLEAFQANFSGNWMAAVGQQLDAPVPQWAWRDVFLARRTTAFVANAQSSAATVRQRAFALGTLAGAAGNLLGSGYLNSVVGGPRRSHQLRHRLAAYSVGAWLRDHEPQYAGTLAGIRQHLTFGQSGSFVLPADIKSLAHQALQNAYPAGTAALPNLDVGYAKLMEHLSLLRDFTLPASPAPMNNGFTLKVLGQGLTPGAMSMASGSSGSSGGGGGGSSETFGNEFPGIGAHEDAGDICATILLWLTIIALFCGGTAATTKNYPGAPGTGPLSGHPGPAPSSYTLAQLQSAGQSPDMISAINSLYGAALAGWQALAAARKALVLRGLIYPESADLATPTFAQFVSTPTSVGEYPLLAMPNSDDGTDWPTSALEAPATSPSAFAASALPLTFLTGDPTNSVSNLSPTLWVDMIEHPGSSRQWSGNFDLDSDRGFLTPCWALASGSAITIPPVVTTVLSFTDV